MMRLFGRRGGQTLSSTRFRIQVGVLACPTGFNSFSTRIHLPLFQALSCRGYHVPSSALEADFSERTVWFPMEQRGNAGHPPPQVLAPTWAGVKGSERGKAESNSSSLAF